MIWICLKKKKKKVRPIKNIWYDWLINYIPEPITKVVGRFKDKIVNLFNTDTLKQPIYERGKKLMKSRNLVIHSFIHSSYV